MTGETITAAELAARMGITAAELAADVDAAEHRPVAGPNRRTRRALERAGRRKGR